MKEPDKTQAGDKAAQIDVETADSQPGPEIRRVPAHPGVVESTPIGEGKGAQAGAPGEARPIGSTTVGDAGDGRPAARAKGGDTAGTGTAQAATPGAPHGTTRKPASRSGFWPMVLGGAVAAGLGAAATVYVLPHLPPEWQQASGDAAAPAEAPDQQALVAAAEEAGRRAAAEALQSADQGAPALPADLADRVAALEESLAAPENSDAADQLAALQQRLDEQQARLEELAARPAFDPEAARNLQQQIETAAAEAQKQLETAQSEAQQLQDAAAQSTRRAEAVAAIAELQAALDRGVSPDEARQTLEDAGLQTPEALTEQVPSLFSLQADFPEAARSALRASLRDTSASGDGNLLTNFLRAQTGARSVEPREGDDPDAILSRADAAVEAGNIEEALAELEALPEPARTASAMSDWLGAATAHTQAQAALSDLSQATN